MLGSTSLYHVYHRLKTIKKKKHHGRLSFLLGAENGWEKIMTFPGYANVTCHNSIFDLFILIILFTKKNDEKQVKIK
jgi:hypothetical protein